MLGDIKIEIIFDVIELALVNSFVINLNSFIQTAIELNGLD
jgi:hypothetical protein